MEASVREYKLSLKEERLVRYLKYHPRRIFSVGELMELLYGSRRQPKSKIVSVMVSNVRKKIPKGRIRILTRSGEGYYWLPTKNETVPITPEVFEFGPFRMVPAFLELRVEGKIIPLSRRLYRLLLNLVKARGKNISSDYRTEAVHPSVDLMRLKQALGVPVSEWIVYEKAKKFGSRSYYRLEEPKTGKWLMSKSEE